MLPLDSVTRKTTSITKTSRPTGLDDVGLTLGSRDHCNQSNQRYQKVQDSVLFSGKKDKAKDRLRSAKQAQKKRWANNPDTALPPAASPVRNYSDMPTPLALSPGDITPEVYRTMQNVIEGYPSESLVTVQKISEELGVSADIAEQAIRQLYQAGRSVPVNDPAKFLHTPWRILDPVKDYRGVYNQTMTSASFEEEKNVSTPYEAFAYFTDFSRGLSTASPVPSNEFYRLMLDPSDLTVAKPDPLHTLEHTYQNIVGQPAKRFYVRADNGIYYYAYIPVNKSELKTVEEIITTVKPGDAFTGKGTFNLINSGFQENKLQYSYFPELVTAARSVSVARRIHNNQAYMNFSEQVLYQRLKRKLGPQKIGKVLAGIDYVENVLIHLGLLDEKTRRYTPKVKAFQDLDRRFQNAARILETEGANDRLALSFYPIGNDEVRMDVHFMAKNARDNQDIQLINQSDIDSILGAPNLPKIRNAVQPVLERLLPRLEELKATMPFLKKYPGITQTTFTISTQQANNMEALIQAGRTPNIDLLTPASNVPPPPPPFSPIVRIIKNRILRAYPHETLLTPEKVQKEFGEANAVNVEKAFKQLYAEGYLLPIVDFKGPCLRLDPEQLPPDLTKYLKIQLDACPDSKEVDKNKISAILSAYEVYLKAFRKSGEKASPAPADAYFLKAVEAYGFSQPLSEQADAQYKKQLKYHYALDSETGINREKTPIAILNGVDQVWQNLLLKLKPGESVFSEESALQFTQFMTTSWENKKTFDPRIVANIIKGVSQRESRTIAATQRPFGDDRQTAVAACVFISNLLSRLFSQGYIDNNWVFTDKLRDFQQGQVLVDRYLATPKKQLTMALIPPKGLESSWQVGFSWTLPPRTPEEQEARMDIPVNNLNPHYVLPFLKSHQDFKIVEDTQTALEQAMGEDGYPRLKEAHYKGLPPKPLSLDNTEVIDFLKRVPKLQAQGIRVLLPQSLIQGPHPAAVSNPFQVPVGAVQALNSLPVLKADDAITQTIQHKDTWVRADAANTRSCVAAVKRLMEETGEVEMGSNADLRPDTLRRMEALLTRTDPADSFNLLDTPENFKQPLLNFQRMGYSWLDYNIRNGRGCLLADGMGLGKTVQTLAYLQKRWNQGKTAPVVIACPKKVMQEWREHIRDFTNLPLDQVVDLPRYIAQQGGKQTETDTLKYLQGQRVILTSYESLDLRKDLLKRLRLDGVILDEAHKINNPVASWSKAAFEIANGSETDTDEIKAIPRPEFRIALSGTPVQNRLGDLWSLMHFTNPGLLGTMPEFIRHEIQPVHQAQQNLANAPDDMIRAVHERSLQTAIQNLVERIRPFILRRTENLQAIAHELNESIPVMAPPIIKTLKLDKIQEAYYSAVLHGIQSGAFTAKHGREDRLTPFVRMQQICNHPAMVKSNIPLPPGSGAVTGMDAEDYLPPKFKHMLQYLDERVLAQGEQAVIFSESADAAELTKRLLEKHLKKLNPPGRTGPGRTILTAHSKIRGNSRGSEDLVDTRIAAFRRQTEQFPVLCTTYGTSGEGLNLQNANHVILLDEVWNPAKVDQALKRINRLGQKRVVNIVRYNMERDIPTFDANGQQAGSAASPTIEGLKENVRNDKRKLSAGLLGQQSSDNAIVSNQEIWDRFKRDIKERTTPQPSNPVTT